MEHLEAINESLKNVAKMKNMINGVCHEGQSFALDDLIELIEKTEELLSNIK